MTLSTSSMPSILPGVRERHTKSTDVAITVCLAAPPRKSQSQEDIMNRIAIAAILLAVPALPASAALSGFYDSGEQISAILSSEAVGNALRQAPIGAITNTGTRKDGAKEWEVRTQECDLKVYLVPKAPLGVGKIKYTVEVPKACE